jgi:hypothetical protein
MKKTINWIELSTFFSTIATLLLVAFTYLQVSRYRNSMKADFAHKIKIDFFNDTQRTLMFLLNNDLLKFKVFANQDSSIYYSYFGLNKEKARNFQNDSIKLLLNIKETYSSYEIEDFLLNHFEDLNLYRKNKIIGPDYLYNGFAWYIESTFENDQIKKLLDWLDTGPGLHDSYKGFREMYLFLQDYRKNLHNH